MTRHAADLRLHVLTDAALCGARGAPDTARAAVAGGATVVQVRAKNASSADLLVLVHRVAHAVGDRATVLVDDRVDVYLAARHGGARVHGVHVGQSDLPVATVRALVGPDAVVGLTAHRPEHLAAVAALPPGCVDYLGVGVVRDTTTKPDHPPVLGVAGIAAVCAATAVPCVAIGGVRAGDLPALRERGAAGVAVVSAVCGAPDPEAAARDLTRRWGVA